MEEANKAGAGNGAGALSLQVERLGRAVPDLCRSPFALRSNLSGVRLWIWDCKNSSTRQSG
jgi:hypothetical protein